MATCPPGKIRRKAYTTKKGTYVRSTCVPDRGLPGKTPAYKRVLPVPKKGALSKYGYVDVKNTPASVRRAALKNAVKKEGYATIIRRLNLVATYNKNSNPAVYKRMKSDVAWIQKNLDAYSADDRRMNILIDGRRRRLYKTANGALYYKYKGADGTMKKKYVTGRVGRV